MIKAIVPLKLMFPITSPFSVETNGVLVEDRRQPHDQPAAEARDKIPTTTPAIPPRATSRRISPAGETAGRLSKAVVGAPVVTSGSAMARSDGVNVRRRVQRASTDFVEARLQYTGRSFRGVNGTTA